MRQFVVILYPLTWEFSERQCLHAGNGQGGPLDGVDNQNDPVLQSEYGAGNLFGTDFAFAQFEVQGGLLHNHTSMSNLPCMPTTSDTCSYK